MATLSLHVASFISLKLNSKNYPLWREQALALAECQDPVGHLTNDTPAPDRFITSTTNTDGNTSTTQTSNPEYEKWKKKSDRLLRGWLIGSFSEESLGLVIGLDSSLAVWNALKGAYAQESQEREFNLKQQITYLRKDEEKGINEHIQQFKGLCDSLAAIGKPVPDAEKVYFLLTTLGLLFTQHSSFDQLCLNQQLTHMAFYSQRPQQRTKKLTSTGRGFQAQQARGLLPQVTPQKKVFKRMTKAEREQYKDETFQFCGVTGHVAKVCWWNAKAQEEIIPQALSALTLDNSIADTEWLMDTGATAHVTGNQTKPNKFS